MCCVLLDFGNQCRPLFHDFVGHKHTYRSNAEDAFTRKIDFYVNGALEHQWTDKLSNPQMLITDFACIYGESVSPCPEYIGGNKVRFAPLASIN